MTRTFILSVAAVALCPAAARPSPAAASVQSVAGAAAKLHALDVANARRLGTSSLTRVRAANRNAVREPDPGNILGGTTIYPWNDVALYRLYAVPGEVSDVALEPGESLISVAAGDTVRWIIGDTASGFGSTRRIHILVKPSAAGLSTNLVIATDRRVYHVRAQSTLRTAMSSIAWTYPDEGLVTLRGSYHEPEAATGGFALEQLNFNYRIEGAQVSWRPLRAFDDGRQVFIEFPASLSQGAAPPLFLSGAKGEAELVNYRVRGHYYVVDRLFSAAELRMGEKRQQVVRIVRSAAAQPQGRN